MDADRDRRKAQRRTLPERRIAGLRRRRDDVQRVAFFDDAGGYADKPRVAAHWWMLLHRMWSGR